MMILALCTIVLFVIVASLIEAWLAKARKAKSEADTLPSGPEASQRSVEKSEAVEQAVDNAGGFDPDERRKARAPKSIPDRRPWFFKTVMGRGLVCLLTKVIPILLPVVWFSLVVMGMLPNPLALFFFSPDPQRMNVVSPSNGWFWLLLTMFIVAVLHDSLPSLLRRLGWMMDEPKTASASLTSMVEDHYGVSNLEVDWFGTAAGGSRRSTDCTPAATTPAGVRTTACSACRIIVSGCMGRTDARRNAMDTEHSYYARVLDEVERLQPVGAGGGILVLNLMYPCFEPGARVGMDLSVRSGEDAFPVGTWKVGRPYTNRYIHCPVRTAGRKVSRCGLPLVAPLDRLNGITGLTWTVTVDLPYADDPIRIIHRSLIFDTQLKVMLTPERPHGSLMAEWPAMGQPDLTLKVNGIKRALSPLVEIDGCAGMPGVFI